MLQRLHYSSVLAVLYWQFLFVLQCEFWMRAPRVKIRRRIIDGSDHQAPGAPLRFEGMDWTKSHKTRFTKKQY
jgi:hypothetical protein